MNADAYWEDRGGVIKGPASSERAKACFDEASADPNSRLVGTLDEFAFYAFYAEGIGHAIRVRFKRQVETLSTDLHVETES